MCRITALCTLAFPILSRISAAALPPSGHIVLPMGSEPGGTGVRGRKRIKPGYSRRPNPTSLRSDSSLPTRPRISSTCDFSSRSPVSSSRRYHFSKIRFFERIPATTETTRPKVTVERAMALPLRLISAILATDAKVVDYGPEPGRPHAVGSRRWPSEERRDHLFDPPFLVA